MTFPNPDDQPAYQGEVPVDGSDFDDETDTRQPTEGGALRNKLTEALARIEELESEKTTEVGDLQGQLMDNAYDALGLDPGIGIGKAAMITYEGDAAGLAEYVEAEYGHTGPDNPLAQPIIHGHALLDAASDGAGSVPVVLTDDEALARAEAKGDYQKTLAMKSQQVAGWFGG